MKRKLYVNPEAELVLFDLNSVYMDLWDSLEQDDEDVEPGDDFPDFPEEE